MGRYEASVESVWVMERVEMVERMGWLAIQGQSREKKAKRWFVRETWRKRAKGAAARTSFFFYSGVVEKRLLYNTTGLERVVVVIAAMRCNDSLEEKGRLQSKKDKELLLQKTVDGGRGGNSVGAWYAAEAGGVLFDHTSKETANHTTPRTKVRFSPVASGTF